MPSLNHIHRYIRNDVFGGKGSSKGNKEYYKCSLKNCSHYIHKNAILGHDSICNNCSQVFTLDMSHLKRSKPVCLMCSRGFKGRVAREIKSKLEGIFEVKI